MSCFIQITNIHLQLLFIFTILKYQKKSHEKVPNAPKKTNKVQFTKSHQILTFEELEAVNKHLNIFLYLYTLAFN